MTSTASIAAHPPPQSLSGKTVLITGAASGLGAALAGVPGECGASVVGIDIQAARLADGMAALRGRGIDARGLGADISDPRGAPRAVAEAAAVSGRLDIPVNHAGTDPTVPLGQMSDADWRRIIGTNLTGPFLLARAALPYMGGLADISHLHNGHAHDGHIVIIASTAAKRAWPNASAYHASKWGLLGLSHALHAELRPENIRVTAVIAGGMRTPFLLDRFPDLDADSLQDPADVAEAIHSVLVLPPTTVVAELTVLPLRETSWP